MKITYPECQVEITAEEFITVIDHFTTKVTCNTAPTFEPGGIISTGDDMPEPKPYPNLTDNETIIQRGEGLKNLIMQAFKEAKDQGMLPEVKIPTEEEPAPTENKKEPAPTKRRTNNKKVQVLFENGWKTFNSISQAAKAIDARLNHLSHALLNGKTCNGHQVRYASDNNEPTQPANEEQPNCPDETQTVTKPKEPYHFMTREELLEKEERIRQASLEAYKEQCRESREKLKDPKSKNNNEWKRINSGIIELDRQYWD